MKKCMYLIHVRDDRAIPWENQRRNQGESTNSRTKDAKKLIDSLLGKLRNNERGTKNSVENKSNNTGEK